MQKFVSTRSFFSRFAFFLPFLSLALFRSFPAQHRVSFAIPAAFSRRKRHRDDTRAGDDNGWRQKREMRILSSWRLCASFVLRPTEPEPSDRRRCPATSSASAGSFLSRCTSFCSCHLSHGLFAPHSFSRSRPLTLSLSRSSRGDTRSAPAVHRYALGSGGSRV